MMMVTMGSMMMVTMGGVTFETRLFTVCWKFELLGSQEMIADVEVMLVACKKTSLQMIFYCLHWKISLDCVTTLDCVSRVNRLNSLASPFFTTEVITQNLRPSSFHTFQCNFVSYVIQNTNTKYVGVS